MSDAQPLRNNPESFWSWFAGFIDGDGSIGFYQRAQGQPVCSVQISQKNKDTLQQIVDACGTGSICVQRVFKTTTYWQLHFGAAASREICAKVLPHLRDAGKRERAERASGWSRLAPGEIANSPEKRADFEGAVAAYEGGLSPAEVAARFGVSQESVRRWAERAGKKRSTSEAFRLRGLKMRGKTKRTKLAAARAEAIRMRASGMSGPAIAKQLGVSVQSVYYWVKVASKERPDEPASSHPARAGVQSA